MPFLSFSQSWSSRKEAAPAGVLFPFVTFDLRQLNFCYLSRENAYILMKSCFARWNPRYTRMKSSACGFRWNQIRPIYPREVGFHHEVISSHARGIYPVRKDGFSWKNLILFGWGFFWWAIKDSEQGSLRSPHLWAHQVCTNISAFVCAHASFS